MALKPGHGLANWEIATIKKIVSEQRRRHAVLGQWEFEDLLQEGLLHWLTVRTRVEPWHENKPPVAYLAQVTRNKLTDLVRESIADKRAGDAGALSLEEPVGDKEDGLTLGDTLAGKEDDLEGISGADARDVRIDLIRVLGRLTPAQQALCALLGEEGVSVREAARRLGVHHSTVYEEMKRIRRLFEEAGLNLYLSDGHWPCS